MHRWQRLSTPFTDSVFHDQRPTDGSSSVFPGATNQFAGRVVNRPFRPSEALRPSEAPWAGQPTAQFQPSGFAQEQAVGGMYTQGDHLMQRKAAQQQRQQQQSFAARFASSNNIPVVRDPGTRVMPTTMGRLSASGLSTTASTSTPEKYEVHVGEYHVGGNANYVAAGVRTSYSPVSAPPWTVQTGKPPSSFI